MTPVGNGLARYRARHPRTAPKGGTEDPELNPGILVASGLARGRALYRAAHGDKAARLALREAASARRTLLAELQAEEDRAKGLSAVARLEEQRRREA
jgi:hypothetical protein